MVRRLTVAVESNQWSGRTFLEAKPTRNRTRRRGIRYLSAVTEHPCTDQRASVITSVDHALPEAATVSRLAAILFRHGIINLQDRAAILFNMTARSEEATLEKIARATGRERLLIAAFEGRTVETGDQLAAIVETARTLRAAGLPFAVIGGIAVGIRSGVPRATDDVDFAVATTAERAAVAAALEGAGFVMRGDFEHSLNYRHPNGEPVQIAFDPAFDQMIERAELLRIDDDDIPVVLTEDLIEMKERASRAPGRRRSKALRDQADAELLRGDVSGPDEGW